MRFIAALFVTFACSGAFASDPGQPLSAEDFVLDLPGLSAESVLARGTCPVGSGDPTEPWWCYRAVAPPTFDAAGFQYAFQSVLVQLGQCAGPGQAYRWNLVRLDKLGTQGQVAHIEPRCSSPSPGPVDYVAIRNVRMDVNAGALYVVLETSDSGTYTDDFSLVRINGFATQFDVLQTFTPQPALGFRVPYMPEGMAAADHFDTYWGPLAHPINFTQAHPLQCDYPAAPPHVGDYLSVNDPLPDPAPGTGRYYVTSATYQGATRYGRKTIAGRLSGRDPAVLPACGGAPHTAR